MMPEEHRGLRGNVVHAIVDLMGWRGPAGVDPEVPGEELPIEKVGCHEIDSSAHNKYRAIHPMHPWLLIGFGLTRHIPAITSPIDGKADLRLVA